MKKGMRFGDLCTAASKSWSSIAWRIRTFSFPDPELVFKNSDTVAAWTFANGSAFYVNANYYNEWSTPCENALLAISRDSKGGHLIF
jgi:hypothetical protein